jgi:hypothetical protein
MNPELLQRVSATTAADWISSMAELGYDCRVLESGRPGELIRTVDTLVNVVFVPRRS